MCCSDYSRRRRGGGGGGERCQEVNGWIQPHRNARGCMAYGVSFDCTPVSQLPGTDGRMHTAWKPTGMASLAPGNNLYKHFRNQPIIDGGYANGFEDLW